MFERFQTRTERRRNRNGRGSLHKNIKKTFISKNKLQKTCKSCCLVKQKNISFAFVKKPLFLHHFYTIFTRAARIRISISILQYLLRSYNKKSLFASRLCVSLQFLFSSRQIFKALSVPHQLLCQKKERDI